MAAGPERLAAIVLGAAGWRAAQAEQPMPTAVAQRDLLSPIQLVVLQGTSFCNLNCTYCDLSVASRRTRAIMERPLLERLFTELFGSGLLAERITIVWHSGEPLTLPPSYYDAAIQLIVALRDSLAPQVGLRFDIQTNGVLIDERWCQLFRRYSAVLDIGVSCDGPADMHDAYRIGWNGGDSHSRTLRGMNLLQEYGIRYKVIAVVSKLTLARPEAFFGFFLERRAYLTGFHFNILAAGAASADPALAYTQSDRPAYYAFYRRLLELTRAADAAGADFAILNFSQCLARILAAQEPDGRGPHEEAAAPLRSLNVDAQGYVTTFYAGLGVGVLPEIYGDGTGLSLGNIHQTSLREMIESEKLQRMLEDFRLSARTCQASCEYFSVCSGGFELTKRSAYGTFAAAETPECVVHVKALVDAMLDDIGTHLDQSDAAARTATDDPAEVPA